MTTKKQNNKWEKIYKEGAHWEKGPSKNLIYFTRFLKKGNKILDIGCGSGRDSIYLAQQDFKVWGIDISKEAIKKAKEKNKLKNLEFSVADAEDLPFKNDFFDVIYSSWVLQSIPLEKAASEIFRVLKKNGLAYLAFLLNTKDLATKKTKSFHKKEYIISAYKKLKVLKKTEVQGLDLKAKRPHSHDKFIIILKKE